ncbi:MAG: hypothetical protein MZV65_52115 [Chromatiales bacterium]|nr:hypothetical protein [Chromatiales bacterium]
MRISTAQLSAPVSHAMLEQPGERSARPSCNCRTGRRILTPADDPSGAARGARPDPDARHHPAVPAQRRRRA